MFTDMRSRVQLFDVFHYLPTIAVNLIVESDILYS